MNRRQTVWANYVRGDGMQNDLDLRRLAESLKQWDDQQVLITKRENGDVDRTIMELEDVCVTHAGQSIDPYFSQTYLQLEGDGRAVMNDTEIPMPSASYEIPVDHLHDADFDGTKLSLTTDRGTYTIDPL
ncbi:MAG TPA: hypothetical protein VFK44_03060 [Bacillales bacterium]|nr:hypothetical protein [Bacillales bacterium]